MANGTSPISSRKRVPRSALSILPIFCFTARVNAPFVTEELAFEQSLGDGSAVDRDEPRAGPPAHLVDRPGQQLLSGAALTEQRNRHVGRRYLLDIAQNPQHFRAARDDAVNWRGGSAFGQPAIFGFEFEDVLGTVDNQPQHVDIDGFLIKVVGTECNRSQCVFAGLVACRNDDLCSLRNR